MTLTIVGLGPGSPEDLTRRVWAALESAQTVILRTERHPCVPDLPVAKRPISCDDLYEKHASFTDVYDAIVARVIEFAKVGDVLYAVPGDPMIGEATTAMLRAAAASAGVAVEIQKLKE